MKIGQLDVRPSILRTRLVPSKFIRRQKLKETAEENKVEQATDRLKKAKKMPPYSGGWMQT